MEIDFVDVQNSFYWGTITTANASSFNDGAADRCLYKKMKLAKLVKLIQMCFLEEVTQGKGHIIISEFG